MVKCVVEDEWGKVREAKLVAQNTNGGNDRDTIGVERTRGAKSGPQSGNSCLPKSGIEFLLNLRSLMRKKRTAINFSRFRTKARKRKKERKMSFLLVNHCDN